MLTKNENVQAQIEGLATLLVLDDEIKRLSTVREFGFFSTNETHRLISYHTAYLWEKKELLGVHLVAQSGTAELDNHAAINIWVKEKIQFILESEHAKNIYLLNINEVESDFSNTLWQESFPPFLLWCPFADKKSGQLSGGLIFFREAAFTESEIKMIRWLLNSYQYTWNILTKPKIFPRWEVVKNKPYLLAILAIVAGILLFPIHLTSLGQGTVAARNPALINAPMSGVIRSFAVIPGEHVKKGQLLITLDNTDLIANAKINQRDYAMTQVKLRTVVNEAFNDDSKRREIPVLQSQLAIDKAQLDYTNALLEKTEIHSPIDGIVIFDSTEDWIGQPVQTGERILYVSNTNELKLKINLPVTERIPLSVGDSGEFYVNGQLKSIDLKITKLGYNAKMTANKTLAYEIEADFVNANELPQIGSQGTAKLYGSRVPFFYYLIRRPLQAARSKLGF